MDMKKTYYESSTINQSLNALNSPELIQKHIERLSIKNPEEFKKGWNCCKEWIEMLLEYTDVPYGESIDFPGDNIEDNVDDWDDIK